MTETPLSDLLCLLDSYASSHENGDSSLKNCIWNISVARKLKGGFHLGTRTAYNPHDIREELRARAVLECSGNDEPNLVDEEEDSRDVTKQIITKDVYTIHLDGIQDKKKEPEMASTSHSGKLNESGLRQRRNKNTSESLDATWTEETIKYDEFEKIRNVDPIELFGALPPPALKIAQKKSRESLTSYIEAANLAVAILRITETKNK